MQQKKKPGIGKYIPLSVRDGLTAIIILLASLGLCFILQSSDNSDTFVPMIFILAVFLVSRFTDGYFYGAAASLISVLLVNWLFTYPYFEFNFTLSGYPVTIICMLAVAITTSALTTRAKEHEKSRTEAEKEKTRSNLLRAVSHDLRTPLTSILGASSAIIDNDRVLASEERIKLLREIQEDARWLIRMVENLLAITRIDGETAARIEKEAQIVEEPVSEAVAKFRKNFSDIPVSVSVPDELLMVPMDALLIEQVLINLLENAALHSQSATQISLKVSREEENAVFKVSDNGAGVPEEMLANLFREKYRKAWESTGDMKKNMGIGLSVCSTIVKAHGGEMTADNNPEGGAVFRFTLPVKEEEDE